MIPCFIRLIAVLLVIVSPYSQAAEFSIFSDVTATDSNAEGINRSFMIGALDFFGYAKIDDNSTAFVEYVFENGGDGLITDLERLWVARTFTDWLIISVGRFHTPLGYWNRNYHHGRYIQDTISRPFFLDFEDGVAGVLPVHIIGGLAIGDIGNNISYEAFIANGPSIDTSVAGFNASADAKPEIGINDAGDVDDGKSFGLRVSYQFDWPELKTSVFYMSNTVAESADTGGVTKVSKKLVGQHLFGIDALFQFQRFDMLLEWFNFSNKNEVAENKVDESETHSATAYYVQFGYRLHEQIKATYRYAQLTFDANDSYFALLGAAEAKHHVLGVRYDTSDTSALSFEINRTQPDIGKDTTQVNLTWSFMIP